MPRFEPQPEPHEHRIPTSVSDEVFGEFDGPSRQHEKETNSDIIITYVEQIQCTTEDCSESLLKNHIYTMDMLPYDTKKNLREAFDVSESRMELVEILGQVRGVPHVVDHDGVIPYIGFKSPSGEIIGYLEPEWTEIVEPPGPHIEV